MDPSDIKWGDSGAEYVVESTGAFTGVAGAEKHMSGEESLRCSLSYVAGHTMRGVESSNFNPFAATGRVIDLLHRWHVTYFSNIVEM